MKLVLVYSRTKSLFYQDIGIHYSYARNGSKKVRCLFKLRYFYYCNFVERKSNFWWIILSQWAINLLISAKALDAFKISFFQEWSFITQFTLLIHCVKSVRIQSFCGPYSVQMLENTDQKNYELRTLFTQWYPRPPIPYKEKRKLKANAGFATCKFRAILFWSILVEIKYL